VKSVIYIEICWIIFQSFSFLVLTISELFSTISASYFRELSIIKRNVGKLKETVPHLNWWKVDAAKLGRWLDIQKGENNINAICDINVTHEILYVSLHSVCEFFVFQLIIKNIKLYFLILLKFFLFKLPK